jgi:hypothetical protein
MTAKRAGTSTEIALHAATGTHRVQFPNYLLRVHRASASVSSEGTVLKKFRSESAFPVGERAWLVLRHGQVWPGDRSPASSQSQGVDGEAECSLNSVCALAALLTAGPWALRGVMAGESLGRTGHRRIVRGCGWDPTVNQWEASCREEDRCRRCRSVRVASGGPPEREPLLPTSGDKMHPESPLNQPRTVGRYSC